MDLLQKILEVQERVAKTKNRPFVRYLNSHINWNAKSICIVGARGTGKTTLLIQDLLHRYPGDERALYLSADHINIISNGLYEIADTHFKLGGEALYIDEIHKYPNWTIELKSIIDSWEEKQVIVSGSSSLELDKGRGDLSRRLLYYELKGLSFREYLILETGNQFGPFPLESILKDHIAIAREIAADLPILKHFRDYLSYGYYPFFLEGRQEVGMRLRNVVEKVLAEDIPAVSNLMASKIPSLKKLLWIVASSEPFTPNIERLSRELNIARDTIYLYIQYLEKAGLITLVRKSGQGVKSVRKPQKIYLDNSVLLSVLSDLSEMDSFAGTRRETFFANQLSAVAKIAIPPRGDFVVNNSFTFEVGGKNKNRDQLQHADNNYWALDGIEIGHRTTIPLYLFGFLY